MPPLVFSSPFIPLLSPPLSPIPPYCQPLDSSLAEVHLNHGPLRLFPAACLSFCPSSLAHLIPLFFCSFLPHHISIRQLSLHLLRSQTAVLPWDCEVPVDMQRASPSNHCFLKVVTNGPRGAGPTLHTYKGSARVPSVTLCFPSLSPFPSSIGTEIAV